MWEIRYRKYKTRTTFFKLNLSSFRNSVPYKYAEKSERVQMILKINKKCTDDN